MTEGNDNRYPSVDEQAILVAGFLAEEIYELTEEIMREFGDRKALMIYIDIIREARAAIVKMRKPVNEQHLCITENYRG
jgi:hypothetical protein